MTLDELAIKYGTDKSSKGHGYCKIYDSYFKDLRKENINFLELGVGGYNHIDKGGNSHRMWYDYFAYGIVHSCDIFQKELGLENYRNDNTSINMSI